MGGHKDDLEYAFEKPVISVSLGLPGIFLLGGLTKEEKPTPILVRDGDCMVMGGGSRLRFHGLAKVLGNDVKLPVVDEGLRTAGLAFGGEGGEGGGEEESGQVVKYLEEHRINVNVRQVLPDGVSRIDEVNDG
ncbi:hypothetical protein TrRE_jg4790 [Triparma retinervis]|uniref:Alpha-ketoglutarate-dependent dioxygenase AlkB-like domain-containing protein n=1 Tax=Triparma retinervis TaxID=2557542 RepID=A0A9W7DQC9_9STRA|nr:hypothetical protein TrRE_jg4790 [Triparma retinervis]